MKKEEIEPNTVYFTNNIEVLAEVVKKTGEVKKNDILKEDFTLRLGKYLYTRTGMVLVSFDEKKELNGCIVISKQRDNLGEYLWLDFAWISPKCPDLKKKFYDEIVGTCKMRGIRRIQARMSRGFKAMQKLYGVYEISKIIEKEVK